MEYKVGNDIIEVERVESSIQKLGESFLNRVFTPAEIEYCESKNKMKYQHYAARFAGKEAIFKAISEFLENKYEIGWKDIEILNDNKGKPFVSFKKKELSNIEVDLSLSHLKEYAIATAIARKEEK
mgnify:FL=1